MITYYSLLLFTLLLPFISTINSDITADRAALLLLRTAVRGRTLRWNTTSTTPCQWEGITCNATLNRVTELRLPGDGLTGQLPVNSIGNLTQLRVLSLRRNSLSGPLPSDLGSCTELLQLILHGNNFSGEFPVSLFRLNSLQRLDLSGNNFSGELSPEFNNLTSLRFLSLENNNFIGSLPDLVNLSGMREFNVSFNRFNGSIPLSLQRFSPGSFLGNSLCGSPLDSCPGGRNGLSGGAVAGIVIGSVFGFLLVVVVLLFLWRKHRIGNDGRRVGTSPFSASPGKSRETNSLTFDRRESHVLSQHDRVEKNPEIRKSRETDSQTSEWWESRALSQHDSVGETQGMENGFSGNVPVEMTTTRERNVDKNSGNDGLVFLGEGVGVFSLEALLTASAELLGKGTIGTTYRAYLESDVVVKRLKNVVVSEREFREKVEGFGVLVHKNLVPIRAYYFGKDEKLIVYESMPMGSLAALLHGNRSSNRSSLTWEIRSKIAFGVACGIEHIHSLNSNASHGNIKASNIFLTNNYTPCVSEFGLTQLVSTTTTSTPNLTGYHAPEAIDFRKVSQKADVYSFGILIFELLTGKAPKNDLNEEGVDLPSWVQSIDQDKWTVDVFDPELLKYNNTEEQLVQLLHVGIHCTSKKSERRPSMMEVTLRIKQICASRQQELPLFGIEKSY